MDQDTTTTIRELRCALARIAGMTGEEARRGTTGVLASLMAVIHETADRALFEGEQREYEAWRAEQPTQVATVAADLPL